MIKPQGLDINHCCNKTEHPTIGKNTLLEYDVLAFSIWPFQSKVSAAARALFNLNADCRTVFSFPDAKDVHLTGSIVLFVH